jgi:hypothetical protein
MAAELLEILIVSAWAGLLSMSIAVAFSMPLSGLLPSFFCGFAARFCLGFMRWNEIALNPAIITAAVVVVVVAKIWVWGSTATPAVVMSGLIPLGAAIDMFKAILLILHSTSATSSEAAEAAALLVSHISIVVTTTLDIAVGAFAGYALTLIVSRGSQFLRLGRFARKG